MGVIKHCFREFLAEFTATVKFLVGEEQEGNDEAGDEADLDVEGQFEFTTGRYDDSCHAVAHEDAQGNAYLK